MDKQKKNILFSVIGGVVTTLLVVLLILFFSGKKVNYTENAYGDFGKAVVISDELDYIFEIDFNKYTRDAVEDAFHEYFLPTYPFGVGIGYVSYKSTEKGHSLRIVDSYGTFHSLTIQEEEEMIGITIDDYKKTYKVEVPDRGDED